ncbi:MAG TPA: hypothetical protein VGC77_22220 [Rhodopseudomonas sp.]
MLAVAMAFAAGGVSEALAQKAIRNGDVLTGQLNALRSRAKGKHVASFQLVSEPRRLPAPGGLCNLETGPQTFQLVTSTEAQAAQLKGLIGKQVSIKVGEMACAEAAGEISEAVISSWSVVATP